MVSSEFTHFRGGKEILDDAESLRAKVELHLAEVAKAEANGSHAGYDDNDIDDSVKFNFSDTSANEYI